MTTRTQWVRNLPDSHLKRLILPEAVFHVAQESQPGRTIGVLSRLVVTGENPANHVFVSLGRSITSAEPVSRKLPGSRLRSTATLIDEARVRARAESHRA